MKICKNFVLTEVSGEYMLVPVGETAESLKGIVVINEPAFFLLKEMSEPKSTEELVSILTSNYDVDEEIAFNDVCNMLNKLLKLGVISE